MNIYRHLIQRAGLGIAALFLLCAAVAFGAQKPVSIPEEIEWTWEVRPPHPDAKLPNVLLLGDSLSRNYFRRSLRILPAWPTFT